MAIIYKKVKLNSDWLGHKESAVVLLNNVTAGALVKRGAAVLIDKTSVKEGIDDAVKDVVKDDSSEGADGKDIASPANDKMIHRPMRQK